MLGLPLLARIALIISTHLKAALHLSHLCIWVDASKLAPTFARSASYIEMHRHIQSARRLMYIDN